MTIEDRPKSISWFERLFFASFAVTFIDMFVHREILFEDEGAGDDIGLMWMVVILGILVVNYGIQILLWFFIAHRASSPAKWIYIILWILGLGGIAFWIVEYSTRDLVFLMITQLLVLGSVICLFTAEARFWFRSRGLISLGKDEALSDVFQ